MVDVIVAEEALTAQLCESDMADATDTPLPEPTVEATEEMVGDPTAEATMEATPEATAAE